MNFLVIDGNSILNRAFYGIKVLTTKDGRFTNAIYGFMNIFLRLKDECQPQAVAVAFDVKQPTFRHEMYGGYKATRKGMPDELAQQMPVLKELLEAMGVPIVEKPGYEADDILGTLARHSGDAVCTIATGDRDSLQLVSDSVNVLLAATKMGRPVTDRYTPEAVREKYGVEPEKLIDIKALMGDSSDNIPGVAGIGRQVRGRIRRHPPRAGHHRRLLRAHAGLHQTRRAGQAEKRQGHGVFEQKARHDKLRYPDRQ